MAFRLASWRISWSSGLLFFLMLCQFSLKFFISVIGRLPNKIIDMNIVTIFFFFLIILSRVPITVVLVQTSRLAVTYQMLITRLAYMLESTLVEPMEKLCLARFSSCTPLSWFLKSSIVVTFASFTSNTYWHHHAVGVSSWS